MLAAPGHVGVGRCGLGCGYAEMKQSDWPVRFTVPSLFCLDSRKGVILLLRRSQEGESKGLRERECWTVGSEEK